MRISAPAGERRSYGSFENFRQTNAAWLEPYAFFRALKDHYEGRPWWEWPEETRNYRKAQSSALRGQLKDAIATHAFSQYLFFGQWRRVRATAARRGLQIIGDIPIFVAMDSADAWSAPHLFELDERTGRAAGRRRRAAGLFRRGRPALGQSALPLGRACGR